MDLLELAYRNMKRNRRRSLLSVMAVVSGMLAMLLFGGYVASLLHGIEVATVRHQGHLQISREGYLRHGSSNPSAYLIDQPERLVQAIRHDEILRPLVRVVTPRLHVQGIAGNYAAAVSRTFTGTGVMPIDERRLRAWTAHGIKLAEARPGLRDHIPDGGVLGFGLAEGLQLCEALALKECEPPKPAEREAASSGGGPELPEDISRLAASQWVESRPAGAPRIELLAASSGGAPNVVGLQVLAAERLGLRELDNMHVVMPIALAQRLIDGSQGASATAVVVQLHDTKDLASARERIEVLLRSERWPVEVHDFKQVNPRYGQVVHLFGTIFGFVAVLVSVVSMFGIANALTMSVAERTGEIGTLRSLGWTRRHVWGMFVVEGAMLGSGGAVLGVALSIAAAVVVNLLDLSWFPPGHVEPVSLQIDLLSQPKLMVAACIGLTLLSAVSAWLPARRAARMEIVEALRHA